MYLVRLGLAVVAVLGSGVDGFYGGNSAVVQLSADNFDKLVVKDDAIWMVEFYAPWCGHCKSLTPEYKKLGEATKGIFKVGAVDADQHKSLGSKYGVQGFPTLKIFGADKKKPSDYQGPREAKGMADALMRDAKTVVTGRLSGGAGSGNNQKNKQKKTDSGSGAGAGKVVELTDGNFDDLVVNSEDAWLVAFTAPWCGHCKSLKPAWKEAAAKLGGKVKIGNVDATVHEALAQRFQIQGFPTIKVFSGAGAGRKSGQDYQGGRTAEDIVSFALPLAAPPKVVELTDTKEFEVCEKEMCVVAIFPSLYEADANTRNAMIKTLQDVSKKTGSSELSNWFWTAAGEQPKMQEFLMRGSTAFPAVFALNNVKKIAATMKSGYDEKNLRKFVVGLSSGSVAHSQQMKGLPEVVRAAKWDGKDAAPITVDEIPLDELFGDDDDEDNDEL